MPSTPNHQIFRISKDQVAHTAGGDTDPQRFVSDVQFVTRFASGIGECLGEKCVSNVIIEDAGSQTAFYYCSLPNGEGSVVNGLYAQPPQSPEDLLDTLYDDDD